MMRVRVLVLVCAALLSAIPLQSAGIITQSGPRYFGGIPEPPASCEECLELTQGVWTEITPPATGYASTYGTQTIVFDPSNHDVLYTTVDTLGLWKSTDRGATWTELGSGTASGGPTTTRLDSPVCIAVNPANSNHLVATQGIRGTSLGFWISTDGGATWTMPSGFSSVSPTMDVTTLAIDPTDFSHMLVGTHGSPAAILETFNAGVDWTLHEAEESWPTGSMGLTILRHPTLEQGNSATWLAEFDGGGKWRTTDSGATWTQVSSVSIPHGLVHGAFYTADGTLYAAGGPYAMKSTDNAASFTAMSDLPSSAYLQVAEAGGTLYTRPSYPLLEGYGGTTAFQVSTDGGSDWGAQGSPGNQTFTNGPIHLVVDEVNNILYAANWNGGLWALKVAP